MVRWRPVSSTSILHRRLLLGLLLFLHLHHHTVEAQGDEGGFLSSLFSVPSHCQHNGTPSPCTFIFTCLMRGGTPWNKCGGGYVYPCCVTTTSPVRTDVRSDRVRNFLRDRPSSRSPALRARMPLLPLYRPFVPRRPWAHVPRFVPVRVGSDPSTSSPSLQRELAPVQERRRPFQHFNEQECGIRKTSQFAKRIIGGNEARFGEFPWQAHIRISGYQCGGVLLNRFFVGTAAHCVHKARLPQITVHLGEFDTKDTGDYLEPFPKETFAVVEKRIHPSFKYMLTQPDRFDIAVLRLSRPVTYRDNILPICLPDPTDDFTGTMGIVAGWGKTDNSFGKTGTNILMKAGVPVITNKECLGWHLKKGINVHLHYEMFCAGHSEGKMDACLGDSGGPLVVHHKGRWTLAGITSAGFGCAVDHQPGIYHKVSVSSGWVAANIRP